MTPTAENSLEGLQVEEIKDSAKAGDIDNQI